MDAKTVVVALVAIVGIIAAVIAIGHFYGDIKTQDSLITIQGTVIDEKNNPLAGVLVTVDGQSDITDNNGKYVIQNVPIGAKTIVAKKESPLYKSAIILKRGDKIMTNDIIITSTIPAPTPTPSPTPTTPPTLTPCIIDTMDSTSGWRTYKDDKGSSINIKSISGRTDNAIEISYDLKEWGWLIISKKINPKILSEKEGIKFFYKGSGEPNTIELKLIYGDVGGTTFGVLWNRATVTDDWVSIEVPYSYFDCWWPDDECLRYGNKLDLTNVRKIEFAISNKPEDGDVYGSGRVIIDDVQGICPE